MISKEEVKKLTELSRIAVSDAELEELRGDLDRIIEYVGAVKKLTGERTTQVISPHHNIFRDDETPDEPGIFSEDLLRQSPDRVGDYVKVKKVLEQGR